MDDGRPCGACRAVCGVSELTINTHHTRVCGNQVVWGFGHTHWSSDNIINSTRVVSNQCGYITKAPDGKGSNYFDPAMVVDVRGALHIQRLPFQCLQL